MSDSPVVSAAEIEESSTAESVETKPIEPVIDSSEELPENETIPETSTETTPAVVYPNIGWGGSGIRVTDVTEDFDFSDNSLVSSINFELLKNGKDSPIAKSSLVIPSSSGWPGIHTRIGDTSEDLLSEPESGVVSVELVMPTIDVMKNDNISVDVTPVINSGGWPAVEWPEPILKTHCAIAADSIPKILPVMSRDGVIDINADLLSSNWSVEASQTVQSGKEDSSGSQTLTISADAEAGPNVKYEKTFANGQIIGASISSPAADVELNFEGTYGRNSIKGKLDASSRVGEIVTTTTIPGDAGDLSLTLSNAGDKPLNMKAQWVVSF